MKDQRVTLIPSRIVCSPSGKFTRWTDLQIIRQQAKQSVEIAESTLELSFWRNTCVALICVKMMKYKNSTPL